ncbi:beta-lactamase family protein [Sphingomonas donggukensis]|uniref:Beta-lactamase family protein n=1 Tax=Sphingomonas donggukensis TaxID=2949093 RepID=A0ABY4TYP3_9SPHN|nr:serine hydrolase domain-containing protein [Sphingomonas donggukensis]URW75666.1 beta-lactamase family protein [Sphingomonas donggukensis]
MRALLLLLALSACATRPAEVRVGFDTRGITATHARGAADRATRRRVTVDDPVRVASISKLVVALGVMRLVEAGTLDLDADVSDRLGWRLRNPAFPDTPITLRLLLSHRSSLTDGIDYIVPLGVRMQDAVGDAKAWDGAHAPGAYFRYANLNFGVVASVIEAATGDRFDRVMVREVMAPLKLDACYNWGAGCSEAAVARAVVLYRANGEVARDDLHGRRPDCPVVAKAGCDLAGYRAGENGAIFSPQGGLRISMRDLATIGGMLLRRGDGFLTPKSIATIEAAAWVFDGANGDTARGFYCRYGLATQTLPTRAPGCEDDLFADGATWVGHAGEAYAVRSGLWIDRARGRGVAFFASGVTDGSKGRSRFSKEEERLARAAR